MRGAVTSTFNANYDKKDKRALRKLKYIRDLSIAPEFSEKICCNHTCISVIQYLIYIIQCIRNRPSSSK